MSNGKPEFDRLAAITIQGGGIYGLSLLGQLFAAEKLVRAIPVALAGTSAGAIIATLYWAGLEPIAIRDEFIKLAEDNALADLIGPPEPFVFLRIGLIKLFLKQLRRLRGCFIGRWYSVVYRLVLFSIHIVLFAVIALILILAVVFSIPTFLLKRGLYTGRNLEELIDKLVRGSPQIAKYASSLPKDGHLTFRHLNKLLEDNPGSISLPALFLTATDLNTQDVVLLNSLDPQFQDLTIAGATRASAGFPAFFSPISLQIDGEKHWFIDGGVISNFPSWAFSYEFRQKIADSDKYRGIAFQPWLQLGLRVTERKEYSSSVLRCARVYAKSLIGLLTGKARDRLEDIISNDLPHSRVIRQLKSDSGGPTATLDVFSLDAVYVREMVKRGNDCVAGILQNKQILFELPGGVVKAEIIHRLQLLCEKANLVVMSKNNGADPKFRSNVFIPQQGRLKQIFQYNMTGDSDENLEFEDITQGLTGFAYTTRSLNICNLAKVSSSALETPAARQYGMGQKAQGLVRADRTWLASMPMLDAQELNYRGRLAMPKPLHEAAHYHTLEGTFDGPIVGVLNLDAALDYAALGIDPRPEAHWKDSRIDAILDLIRAEATVISKILSDHFAA